MITKGQKYESSIVNAIQSITIKSSLSKSNGNKPEISELIKQTARSFIYYKQTRRWLQFLNSNPILIKLARLSPRLVHKIFRPYLSNRLNCSDRVSVLIGHYDFILRNGLGPLVLHAAQSHVMLGECQGKSGETYSFHLTSVAPFDRESEFALHLVSDAVRIYSVAFTFVIKAGIPSVKIGCLQGLRADNGASRIRNATRDLHGLRPKDFMVRLVREIGNYLGCEDLLLVSNKNKVICHRRRRNQVFFDYDQTWEEMGAIRLPDNDFKLSCSAIQNTPLEDIPSRKRSEAKKRYAMIDSAVQSIRNRLTAEKTDA